MAMPHASLCLAKSAAQFDGQLKVASDCFRDFVFKPGNFARMERQLI
jgi:hypothetical protein